MAFLLEEQCWKVAGGRFFSGKLVGALLTSACPAGSSTALLSNVLHRLGLVCGSKLLQLRVREKPANSEQPKRASECPD